MCFTREKQLSALWLSHKHCKVVVLCQNNHLPSLCVAVLCNNTSLTCHQRLTEEHAPPTCVHRRVLGDAFGGPTCTDNQQVFRGLGHRAATSCLLRSALYRNILRLEGSREESCGRRGKSPTETARRPVRSRLQTGGLVTGNSCNP